jgi:hypothetical protein
MVDKSAVAYFKLGMSRNSSDDRKCVAGFKPGNRPRIIQYDVRVHQIPVHLFLTLILASS